MIRNSTLLLFLITLLLSGCTQFEPTVNFNVTVERKKEEGTWHITYDSDRAFKTLNFDRQRFRLRTHNWRVLTKGVSLSQSGAYEQVQSEKPISHFEVEFDDHLPGVANDYPIVSYFSDGGAVIYTGHLLLKVPECNGCQVKHQFKYITPEDESVITQDNDSNLGDFVYFGTDELQEYDSFDAVTDRRLPDWIKRQIERSLPTFLIHYQDRLQFSLPRKPLVFVAYDRATEVREEGYIGGVVGSHMQLVLVGKQWEEADGTRYEKFAHLTAHEVFHLWNGALFLAPDQVGGSWLHEGSADAIADFALYELGYYGEDRYHEVQTERLNRCLLGLAIKPLPQSDERGFYRNFYECGAVMNHILERKLNDGVTLFDLWRSIFKSSQEAFYSHSSFFSSAKPLVSDPSVLSVVAKISSGRTGEPAQFIETAFDELEIPYSITNYSYPAWYEELASRNVVSLLAERDCGKSVSVDSTETGIFVEGTERCSSIKSHIELRNVNGYPLPYNGVEAHDSLFEQCIDNPIATAYDGSGQEVATSCHSFPRRPDFITW